MLCASACCCAGDWRRSLAGRGCDGVPVGRPARRPCWQGCAKQVGSHGILRVIAGTCCRAVSRFISVCASQDTQLARTRYLTRFVGRHSAGHQVEHKIWHE